MTQTLYPELIRPPGAFITPFSRESVGAMGAFASAPTSTAWSVANRAIYVPFYLLRPITVSRMFVLNGATVGTNNWDIGVYASNARNEPGVRLVSKGSTASAGANVCQYFPVTATVLPAPATYWMALAMNGTTDTMFRSAALSTPELATVIFAQSTAFALPNPATPIAITVSVLPMFGICQRSSP